MPPFKLSGLEIVLHEDGEEKPELPDENHNLDSTKSSMQDENIKKYETGIDIFVVNNQVELAVPCVTMTPQESDNELPKLEINGVGNYVCDFCGTMFSREEQLHKHMEVHQHSLEVVLHEDGVKGEIPEEMPDEICYDSTASSNQEEDEFETKLPVESFKLISCSSITPQEPCIAPNKKLNRLSVDTHVCEICGTLFSRKQHLHRHKENIHSNYSDLDLCIVSNHGEKGIQCNLCESSFGNERGLRKHKESKHRADEDKPFKLFKCSECDFTTAWVDSVNRHMESKHRISEYLCDMCSYIGHNVRSLKRHMKKHEGLTFSCSECKFSCNTHEQLYAHSRNCAIPDKLFKCRECDSEYPTSHKLMLHVNRKHRQMTSEQTCPKSKKIRRRRKTVNASSSKTDHKCVKMSDEENEVKNTGACGEREEYEGFKAMDWEKVEVDYALDHIVEIEETVLYEVSV